jgi:hypothetical protein
MVMSITSMMRMTTMVMMVVPSILNGSSSIISRVWGVAGLLLNSRAILPLSVLLLVILNLLLLALKDEGLVHQFLVVIKGCHGQLNL